MQEEQLYIDNLEETTDKKPENYLAVLNSGVQRYAEKPYHLIREKGRKEYHLLYIEERTCTAYHEGVIYTLSKGQYILYEPKQRQEYILQADPPSVSVSYWIHFKGTYIAKILDECGLKGGVFTAANPLEVSQLFPNLVYATLPSTHATEIKINSLMFSILYALTEKKDNAMFHESVRKAVMYLQKNLYRNVKVEELSVLCNLSRSRFMYLFKKSTGTSVHQYHLILRMEQAKKYLLYKDYSIAEVAFILGFEDPLYFSRIFRKITGISPREFRKKHT